MKTLKTAILISLLSVSYNSFADLNNGLVAYYCFDDATNISKDCSTNGNNGSPTGQVNSVTGVKGNAANFGGYNNPASIHIPNSSSLQFVQDFTISFALKMTGFDGMDGWGSYSTFGAHSVFAKSHDRTGMSFLAYGDNATGNVGTGVASYEWGGNKNDVGAIASNSTVDKWVTFTYVFSNSSKIAKLYADGVLIKTNENFNQDLSSINSQDLYLGKFSDSWYPLNGSLDEVRIYNRALTAAEVTALYQQGTTPCTKVANNPCYQEIKAEIVAIAKEKNIPPVIIQSIAFKESGWLHFDTQQYTLDYCVANVGLPLVKYSRACEKDGRVGIGMMQVTVFPNDSNFNQLSSDWKYNLRAGVDKLWSKWQTQRTEAPNDTGFDIDPTVIEAWYYPVMWYNGENARAWDYVKSAFQYMSAEPPLNLSNVWDKVTGIKNPQGILDMPNKETYHVKDLALKSVPIHQWNPTTGKYADITSQVLNGETPTAVPTVVKDNWTPFADGFDMPFSGSPAQSQNYLDFLGVYGGTTYDGYHPGEDWKVPFNGYVFSIANGKVERVGSSTGLGYYLVIRHQLTGNSDSFYSVFYHLKKPLVSKGEKVYRGQKVAVIGDFDVPVHLHFELRNFLPTNLYANDNAHGLGYYGHGVWDANSKDYYGTDDLKLAAEKIMLKDGFFIAPATFVSENAPSSVSGDVSALMRTYQNAGLINKTLNQYFVEKRGQFIAILIRALEKRANQTLTEAADLPYADVPLNSGIRSSLLKACQLKILSACAGGTQTKFNPDMPITRQEALAFTIRAYEALKQPIVFDSTKANTFVDVPESNTFNQTVVKGYQVGLTSGVVDGTYRYFYPARWVQRGEAVSFVEKLVIQLNAK